MKNMLLLLLALICLSSQPLAAGQLTILTENLPPLNYLDNGTLVGSSVEDGFNEF